MTADDALPPEAYAAALGGCRLAAARLRSLLEATEPRAALRRVCPTMSDGDVRAVWEAHRAAGVAVHVLGTPSYPARLAEDHEAPAVLFARGHLGVLDAPLVTIV